MPEQHAKFSPSAAHRWMRCPASIGLCAGIEDTGSDAAREGTAAHFLASECLDRGHKAEHYLGKRIAVADSAFWMNPETNYNDTMPGVEFQEFAVDVEMCAYVQQYLDYVRRIGGLMLVEQRLDLSGILGVPGQFGTGDHIALVQRVLYGTDFKYGAGEKVSAIDSDQGILYLAGAYEMLKHVGDIEEVVFAIHQPRLDHVEEWRLSVEELQERLKPYKEAAANAESDSPRCEPGEKQCRWCRAKGARNEDDTFVCPAAAQAALDAVLVDFKDLTETEPKEAKAKIQEVVQELAQTDVPLFEETYAKVRFIELFCAAMHDQARVEALAGRLSQFKAVTGRRGARAWEDAAKVEEAMKAARLKLDDMYERKLITPTAAEKTLKNRRKLWPQLEAMIVQPEGKPTIVPMSDPREAIVETAAAISMEGFENITEKGE